MPQMMIAKLRLVFAISIFFMGFYAIAQTAYWEPLNVANARISTSLPNMDVNASGFYMLNEVGFKKELENLTVQDKNEATLFFPSEQGKLVPYTVHEIQIMAPELAAKFPGIRSYAGYAKNQKEERIRFSVSHQGIQSMMIHTNASKTSFMQPVSKDNKIYALYHRMDTATSNFICNTQAEVVKNTAVLSTRLIDDQILRKYRLAVSATGEYTQYHGGTIADALAAINATVTRVNEVFERDLGVSLELVANNDQVIFTNPSIDPYTGNLNAQAQNTLSTIIGEANYDVGHVFNQDQDNGNAGFIGSVCVDNRKGSAFSSGLIPEGDKFDLDFVAHELGHQFGANHTWSFESEGTLVQAEPGSGTTIMGYAGIAGVDNIALQGDDYFHHNSILQIAAYIENTSCAMEMPLTNVTPEIIAIADYTIPIGTPFVLEGNATDTDAADVLTYAWEQIDNGVVNAANFGPDNPGGANFRSQLPSTNGARFFPKLSSIIAGDITQSNPTLDTAWETLSTVQREMNFALTVRDNAFGGGQVVSDQVKIQVVVDAGPFVVTSQSGNENYAAGSVQEIRWNVAETNNLPINAEEVSIFLSIDGGLSFPINLASNVLNDGVHEVLFPNFTTNTARIMVKAQDNIFFAVNRSNFSIVPEPIVLDFEALTYEICMPDNLEIPFNYISGPDFNEEVAFTVMDLPAGLNASFSPNTAISNTSVTLTISNTTGVAAGSYPITIMASSTNGSKEVPITLNLLNNSFSEVALNTPLNGALDTAIAPLLEWESNVLYTSYDVEVATDSNFTTIVLSDMVLFNFYLPTGLQEGTTYFWRVRPKNNCGEGNFNTAYSFTTVELSCRNRLATDLPQEISTLGTPMVVSKINFADDLPIADVNVNLDIDHSFVSDLTVRLIAPSGTTVVLVSNSCGSNQNINATFDDDGNSFSCGSDPAIMGTVRPLGSLASFQGESLLGEWTLEVQDNAAADGGNINAFSLDICVEGELRPDADADGVFDDGPDLCLGTPVGTAVDADGCPLIEFPEDNFLITTTSVPCPDVSSGGIAISAATLLNYTATVQGNGLLLEADFVDTVSFENLTLGTYEVFRNNAI